MDGVEVSVDISPTLEELVRRTTAFFAGAIREAINSRHACSVALSGGTTPRPILQKLAAETLNWAVIDFYFVDERCVPADHADSNFKMANEALFQPLKLSPDRIHRMEGENPDREAAAAAYERTVPRRLDVVMLGIGEDGHTASIFPGSPLVNEQTRRVAAIQGAKPPPWRLTLTPPAFEGAVTFVVGAGAGKAHAVARALESDDDPQTIPVKLFRTSPWFLDQAAASELRAVHS